MGVVGVHDLGSTAGSRSVIEERGARLIERIDELHGVGSHTLEHIASSRMHVLQVAVPFSLAHVDGEHGKLILALYHVAFLGMVVVLGQCGFDGQVEHGCIANVVPSRFHGNGAQTILLDDVAGNLYAGKEAGLDAVALGWRDTGVSNGSTLVGQPLSVLIDEREVIGVIGNNIAVLPIESVEQVEAVAESIAIDVERYPVPPLVDIERLLIVTSCAEDDGVVDAADNLSRLEIDLL